MSDSDLKTWMKTVNECLDLLSRRIDRLESNTDAYLELFGAIEKNDKATLEHMRALDTLTTKLHRDMCNLKATLAAPTNVRN